MITSATWKRGKFFAPEFYEKTRSTMNNAAKWKEFVRWWEMEYNNLCTEEDVDEVMWRINLKIRQLRKRDNAKQ